MLKNKIIRTVAVIICVIAVLSASVLPCFAVDINTGSNSTIMTTLFNYDYIELTYQDGSTAVFSLKDAFYQNFFIDDNLSYTLYDTANGERSITIFLYDAQFEQYPFTLGGSVVNLPYWRLSFMIDVPDVVSARVHSNDSIYNFSVFNTVFDNFNDTVNFYDYDLDLISNRLYNYSSSGNFYYPLFSYSDGQIVGRSLQSLPQSSGSTLSGSAQLTPYFNVAKYYNRMPTDVSDKFLFFGEFTTSFDLPVDTHYLKLSISYIPVDNVVSFHDYYLTYFPGYRTDNVSVDFTSWISTALSGFLSFSFMPGFTIGGLLLFVLGLGCFMAFLRYFAGG